MLRQIGIGLAIFAVGIGTGYFLMPKKETVRTVEKQVDRVITVIKRPDGTVEKVTTDKSKTVTEDSTKDIVRSKVNLSALAGLQNGVPTYGLHVNKELLGPISVGAWGLTNKTLGVSLGLNF